MSQRIVGILHPGSMGVSIAAAAKKSGNEVYWVSAGRSAQSRERAEEQGLLDAGTLDRLCEICELILSICPPHAAEEVAGQVAARSFGGLYLDANAIAPQRAERIGGIVEEGGARFVDGGIVGGPAWGPGKTWLHLAGAAAEEVASFFSFEPLVVNVLGTEVGKASALKMCFAANTKGTTALLCAILATAERLGVREALCAQWGEQAGNREKQVRGVTAKAWRFEGEMREISSTFAAAGLPGGFHAAAAELYSRIARFKDAEATPSLEEVLAALMET